jgi:uncharacterized membrane protein
MDVIVAGLVVGTISFVSGGFGIPIGFALGLEPLEVYVAASLGSVAAVVLFLYAGDKLRDRLVRDRLPTEPDPDSRSRRLSDRYGAKGLGLVGPLFPGVTASVLIGLSLGLRRASLARWMSLGIVLMYALYTVGFWVLVELVGVE